LDWPRGRYFFEPLERSCDSVSRVDVLGAAFAVAAMIIVGATIRMAVLARSREIELLR